MRVLWILVLGCLAATEAAAQDRGGAAGPEPGPELVRPSPLTAAPLDARLVPAANAPAPPLELVRAEQARDRDAAGPSAVLDEHFWRSVLAGVIVTVVSTLILRVIL